MALQQTDYEVINCREGGNCECTATRGRPTSCRSGLFSANFVLGMRTNLLFHTVRSKF